MTVLNKIYPLVTGPIQRIIKKQDNSPSNIEDNDAISFFDMKENGKQALENQLILSELMNKELGKHSADTLFTYSMESVPKNTNHLAKRLQRKIEARHQNILIKITIEDPAFSANPFKLHSIGIKIEQGNNPQVLIMDSLEELPEFFQVRQHLYRQIKNIFPHHTIHFPNHPQQGEDLFCNNWAYANLAVAANHSISQILGDDLLPSKEQFAEILEQQQELILSKKHDDESKAINLLKQAFLSSFK